MKDRIIELLQSTKREGMNQLINHMEESGFFDSPCSTSYHLACVGGLAEHSLNVYEKMKELASVWLGEDKAIKIKDSLKICALLHDLGKSGQFGKPNYVEKILKSGKQSTASPYEANKELLFVDHEIRSIVIASTFIKLTEEEQQAILWHNGLYGVFKYEIQGKETPLYMLLHFSDMWASRVDEGKNTN